MNRSVTPDVKFPGCLNIPLVLEHKLDNGISVYSIPDSKFPVLKIEFVFKSGKWFENENLTADFSSRMLRSGVKSKTALELSSYFDDFGSQFGTQAGNDYGLISLHCLNRNIDSQLSMIRDVIDNSLYPQNEFDVIRSNRKQRILVEFEKNDFLSNRKFVSSIWGNSHPYGRCTELSDFDELNTDIIRTFSLNHYHGGNLFIIISGEVGDNTIKSLNSFFGDLGFCKENKNYPSFNITPANDLEYYLNRDKAVQTSIQVGMLMPEKKHPDFIKLTFANLILGGYFGSRLMANIREEKGYTYGIFSSIAAYKNGCFLEINTEVGKEFRKETLIEIEKEIKILQNELVSEQELITAKNYMIGKMMRSTDGALRFSDSLKSVLMHNQDISYFKDLFTSINQISSSDVQQMACKYFSFEDMFKISVG